MTAGSVHIAKDTIYGREALCGREAMFAVYPNEVVDVPHEDICAECRRLLGSGVSLKGRQRLDLIDKSRWEGKLL